MKYTVGYIDIDDECLTGTPKLLKEEVENPIVKTIKLGKNLNIAYFEKEESDSHPSLECFVNYLANNKKAITVGEPILGEEVFIIDMDILYNEDYGFVKLPWTDDRILDKCYELKSNLHFLERNAFEHEENGVRIYNLGVVNKKLFDSEDSIDLILEKGNLIYQMQSIIAPENKEKNILGINYGIENDNVFISMPNKNYLDSVNLIKELYKDVTNESIAVVNSKDKDYFTDKEEITVYDDGKIPFFRFKFKSNLEGTLYSEFMTDFVNNIDNHIFEVAEDIIEGIRTYKDDNIEIYETSPYLGIYGDDILDIISKRKDKTPEVVLIYKETNTDAKYGIETTIAKKSDNGFEFSTKHIPESDKNAESCKYIDLAEELSTERERKEKEKEKDIELN